MLLKQSICYLLPHMQDYIYKTTYTIQPSEISNCSLHVPDFHSSDPYSGCETLTVQVNALFLWKNVHGLPRAQHGLSSGQK